MPDVNETVVATEQVAEPKSILDVLDAQFPNAPDDPTVPQEPEAVDPDQSEKVEDEEGEKENEPDAEKAEKEPEPTAEKPAEPAPVSEAEKEIADLGLKSERSQKRFKELYERASKVSEMEETLKQQEQVFQTMENLGVTPDQFSQAIGLIGFINSQDPGKLEMAYEVLSQELAQIGRKIGKSAPGYDPVQDDPDLLAKVKRGELDPADAAEFARLKRQNQLVTERTQAQVQAQAQMAEAEACRQSLNQLETHLRANDPLYEAKRDILMPILKAQMASVPFADRPALFMQAYQSIKLPAMVAPSAAPSQVVRPDPANTARPKSGAGGPVPTSTLDAVEMAIRGSRRDY